MLRNIKILIVFIIFAFSGCGLFDTRDVEPPVDARSNFIPPASPEIVIINIKFAISERNVTNYLQCFVDTSYSEKRFSYTADISSQIQYPVFHYWNLGYENSYFTNLRSFTNPSATSNLFLTNENFTGATDSVVFDADYLLRFDHQKPAVAKTTKGKLRFVLAVDSRSLWSIHRWIDYKINDSDTTWSVLKANFSN
ncbi:MAG TPA: hypothetical protein VIK14_08555 [Ignavibacteria bacterium]